MMELTYLPAGPEDIEEVFRQCKALVLRYEDPKEVDFDRVIPWLEKKIRTHISRYTCVYRGEEKVGYFCLAEETDGFELDDLYVLEPYRGQGIGSYILNHCIRLADQPIYLYVFTGNHGAIRLYERHGFTCTRQVSPTRIIMTRYP